MEIEEILKAIVMGLVLHPEGGEVARKDTEAGILLEIRCLPSDRKYLIGKGGKTFKMIDGLMKKIGFKNNERLVVKIYENENEPNNSGG